MKGKNGIQLNLHHPFSVIVFLSSWNLWGKNNVKNISRSNISRRFDCCLTSWNINATFHEKQMVRRVIAIQKNQDVSNIEATKITKVKRSQRKIGKHITMTWNIFLFDVKKHVSLFPYRDGTTLVCINTNRITRL